MFSLLNSYKYIAINTNTHVKMEAKIIETVNY
mgnify:FL=1